MYYFLKVCSIAVIFLGFTSFKTLDPAWQEYFQNEAIKIEIKAANCSNPQAGTSKNYILLRISNKTSNQVDVSFFKELWYDGACSNCNSGDEARTHLVLQANQVVEGTCETPGKDLKILQSMSHASKKVLTKFEIKDVQIQNK